VIECNVQTPLSEEATKDALAKVTVLQTCFA